MDKGIDRQKSEMEKLKQVYKQWQQFASKSKIKMRKKVKKDKQEYYDFDYTRGQYYYSYPENHIAFAQPEKQRQFFRDLLQRQTAPFIDAINQRQQFSIQDTIRPLQLQSFLKEMKNRMQQNICLLRIKKSLYIHEGRSRENLVDLMENQIRSFFHRYTRLNDVHFTFSKSMTQRLQDRTSSLKIKKFDELHFSQLQKGDFVVFMRLENVRQRLTYNLNSLQAKIKLNLRLRLPQIIKQSTQLRSKNIKLAEVYHAQKYLVNKQKIHAYFIENSSSFFESDENLNCLQNYLVGLDYTKQMKGNQYYFDIKSSLREVKYIPSSQQDLQELLFSICRNYFPDEMISGLFVHKKQHLCYRLNYFISLMLRTLTETYNYIVEIKEKDLHQLRNTIRRELETIFTSQIDKLFNIFEHDIVLLVDEGDYRIKQFPYVPKHERQNIFNQYFKVYPSVQPFTQSILNILSATSDRSVKEVVDAYIDWVYQISPHKMDYLSLFYRNCKSDNKNHVVNIINSKMLVGSFSKNPLQQKFSSILQKGDHLDKGLLKVAYLLSSVNSMQTKQQILNILNGQIAIMYKLRYRLKFLEHKHNLPFQMSTQFISRFTETNNQPGAFDFTAQTNNQNTQIFNMTQYHDKIFRIKKGSIQRVEVRRVIPENPLFEGKRIMYRQAIKECQLVMQKIHNICAYMIEHRENYLHQQKFTGIVDRFQLINQLLHLELKYQNNKLKYMESAISILEKTVHPEGLTQLCHLITQAKGSQVYINLNCSHFKDDYEAQSKIWQIKSKLLNTIHQKQVLIEQQQRKLFRQDIKRHNHINNVPQVSSIYYCDQLPMEMEDDNIVEEADEESLSEQQFSQSQFVFNSSKYRSDFSVVSSEYHVKATFKQILGRNSINAQASQQNRRDQLMGKKRKQLVNDSVLGGLISYQGCDYYHYIHLAANFIDNLDEFCYNLLQSEDPILIKQFYEKALELIDKIDDQSIRRKQIIEENLLNNVLRDAGKAINKVVQKYKSNPSSIQDYLFMGSDIIKNLIENSNQFNANEVRGLYTCLNMVKLQKIHFQNYLLDISRQNIIFSQLGNIIKKHSGEFLPKQNLIHALTHIIQEPLLLSCVRLFQSLTPSSNRYLLFLSQNSIYTSTMISLFHILTQFYQNLLISISSEVTDYKLLQIEIQALQQCSAYTNISILDINNIESKLFLRRKSDFINERLIHIIKYKDIEEIIALPKNQFKRLKKYKIKDATNQQNLLENIATFEDFILELNSISVTIQAASHSISRNVVDKGYLNKLSNIMKILPFANKYIDIKEPNVRLYKDIFHESYQTLMAEKLPEVNPDKKVTLYSKKFDVGHFGKSISRELLTTIKKHIRPLLKRVYLQFSNPDQLFLQKCYDYVDVTRSIESFRLKDIAELKQLFQFMKESQKISKLMIWIECKLLLFGASLSQEQLILFRMVLENVSEQSPIFFRDESSRLVRYKDISKMKIQNMDSSVLIDSYIKTFLNYENVKIKYKIFLDNLIELDIKNQGKEIINLLYIANKTIVDGVLLEVPDYLANYCFIPPVKDQTTKFIEFAVKSNPNRKMRGSNKLLTFSVMKTFIWKPASIQNIKNEINALQERCSIIKQTLNSNNTKMVDLTEQLGIQLYKRERMRQLHSFLKIPINNKSKLQYNLYLKKLQQNLLLGQDKLCPIQKYLSKFMDKILKNKPQLAQIKDEVFDKIYQSRFFEDLIIKKLLSINRYNLGQQLELYQVLYQNYHQKDTIREKKIIKNTFNKVLVPKIIINPYLQSPLILENYFFAASLKLSYIDSFLNKLKNRAIMVELAEGGFGFLLKINQLDECIQSLCKGIITFTQKEFNDRFRTFFERFSELKQKYKKSCNQNQHLKETVSVCRNEWGKQIKSVIYSKLNSYLVTLNSKQRTYESVFNILKSIQMEVAKEFDIKYQNKIKNLEEQNRILKQKFTQFKQIYNKNVKSSMQQSKDALYNKFKKEIDSILNKEVIQTYEEIGQKHHHDQQEYSSTLLLKRLRTQKIFYELKISTIEQKLREKNQQIQKIRQELVRTEGTLTAQQFKSAQLIQEIKLFHNKNIEIEDLKKQIHEKEEETILNKFKFIKINEQLQGKVNRYEEKKKLDISKLGQQKKKQETSIAIQTSQSEKKERRNFKIRTQYSQPTVNQLKVDEVPLWKEKWENSERRYQAIMSQIIQNYEIYKLNKNSSKLIERIGQLFEDCLHNKLGKKI